MFLQCLILTFVHFKQSPFCTDCFALLHILYRTENHYAGHTTTLNGTKSLKTQAKGISKMEQKPKESLE